MAHKGEAVVPDTGTLRGDLLAAYCGSGGLNDPHGAVRPHGRGHRHGP